MKVKTVIYGAAGPPIQEEINELAPHSVELSCNAKGQYSWTIKIYFGDDRKVDIAEDLELIANQIKAKFVNPEDEAQKIKDLMSK